MLQFLRDRITGVFAWFIVGILVVPFAFWGVHQYSTVISDNYVAQVNGKDIAPQDFRRTYELQYQRMQSMYGKNFRPDMIDESQLRESVVREMIREELVAQQVQGEGYRVGNALLARRIRELPAFQVGGKFQVAAYQDQLRNQGLTPLLFEQKYRRALEIDQLQSGITGSAFVTGRELNELVALRYQERKVGFATINAATYLADAKPSDDDIKAYYDAHKDQFMTPERVTLAYVGLDAKALGEKVKVTDADLQAFYQQQADNYMKAEQREAAHILIVPDGKGPKADAAAKAKAEDVLKKIRAGADFAKMAKEYSQDPGSAKQGGELGWVQHGVMVKPFEDALYSIAKQGDIVGPIKTRYGYHIIKLEGIKKPQQQPFDAVKAQIEKDYRTKKGDDEYYALGDKLANLAYEHPNSLADVSKELDLTIKTVADVTRSSGTGIAGNEKVRTAAFSDSVLTQGQNSDPIEVGENHAVVIRVQSHQPAEQKPLASVRDQIVQALKQQAAAKQAEKVAQALQAKLQGGVALTDAAKGIGAQVTPAAFIHRQGDKVPSALADAVFKAPHPAAGKPVFGAVAIGGGNQAVYVIDAVKQGDTSALVGANLKQTRKQLARMSGMSEAAEYVADLHEKAKIDIKKENMEQ